MRRPRHDRPLCAVEYAPGEVCVRVPDHDGDHGRPESLDEATMTVELLAVMLAGHVVELQRQERITRVIWWVMIVAVAVNIAVTIARLIP